MSMMHAVQYDAHALPSCDESADADEVEDECDDAPCSSSARECDKEVDQQACDDPADPETTSEDDTGPISVANGPADEVGMCLAAEGPLDCPRYRLECRGVGGVLEGVE